MLKQLGNDYLNFFDVVLANMPQTPSRSKIRSNIRTHNNIIIVDKFGGDDGVTLYSELINFLGQYVVKDFVMFNL